MVGNAAVIRVSSVMCRSASSGTLKSTRTRTRLPATSISRIVFLFIIIHLRLEAFLCDEVCEISDAAGITPLVVIPGKNFDHFATGDQCREAIDNRRAIIATVVRRDKRFIRVSENAFE